MMAELETLRRELAAVKSANPLMKAAPAERALDAVVLCLDKQAEVQRLMVFQLVELKMRLSQLEERESKNVGQ